MNAKIRIIKDDITNLKVDVIVNAANKDLNGGSGVDGDIHLKAGPNLLQECLSLGGCKVGEAKITGAYNLPCRNIIHTVGPIWQGGRKFEAKYLARCYVNSLRLAQRHGLRSIAFPAISTGAYKYPLKPATNIAVSTVTRFVEQEKLVMDILFVCFNDKVFREYQKYNKIFE